MAVAINTEVAGGSGTSATVDMATLTATLTGASTAELKAFQDVGVSYQPLEATVGDVVIVGAKNSKTITGDTTFTFNEVPAAATETALILANGATPRTITIPSSYSLAQGTTITSFTLPANATVELNWLYNGTNHLLAGEPLTQAQQRTLIGAATTAQTVGFTWSLVGTASDRDYTIVLKAPFAFSITEATSKAASGTGTGTVKINTTALGGTANSFSSSEQSQAHSTNNAVAAGDDIILTMSSTSTLVDPVLTISGTRTLA